MRPNGLGVELEAYLGRPEPLEPRRVQETARVVRAAVARVAEQFRRCEIPASGCQLVQLSVDDRKNETVARA